MYKIKREKPLTEFNNLLRYNRSKLTFLEFCYGAGFVTMNEWQQFRGIALRGGLNG